LTGFGWQPIDGQHSVRAHYSAQGAACAFALRINQMDGAIAAGVEEVGHEQHMLRAHSRAQLTTLTTVCIDNYSTSSHILTSTSLWCGGRFAACY
jgi:hypothetical protein